MGRRYDPLPANSARANSCAELKRSSARLASARTMATSSPGSITNPGATSCIGGKGIFAGQSDRKGGNPVSISYPRIPTE